MKIHLRALGTAIFILIMASSAQALTLFSDESGTPMTLKFDNSLGIEWHNDHDFGAGAQVLTDDFLKIDEILKTELRYKAFTIGMRFDVRYYPDALLLKRIPASDKQFHGAPLLFSQEASSNDYRFERYYFIYDSPELRIDLGDFYASFGRGLALSLRREAEGEFDTSARGAKLRVKIKDTTITGLAGFSNTLNIDPNHETSQKDPNDLITGFRFDQRLLDLFSVAGHAVYAEFGALESEDVRRFIGEKSTTIFGGSIEFPDILGYASLYFEGNYMRRAGREVDETMMDYIPASDTGTGLYGSASVYIENFTLTGEYKMYKDFIFRRGRTYLGYILEPEEVPPLDLVFFEDITYNNAPTLERTDIETNRTYGNDHGFRLRADYNVLETGTQPYVAFYYTINQFQEQGASNLGGFGSNEEFNGDRIWHVYGGVTQYFHSTGIEAFIDGGFRDELTRDAIAADGSSTTMELLEMVHLKTGASFPIISRHAMGFELFFLQKDEQLKKQLERDVDITLSYNFADYIALSFLYTIQERDFLPGAGEDELNHFFAGEVSSSLFENMLQISIFAGQVRESYRCYGGFCRKVPPFEGIKARIRLMF